jgi:hypothetical protein
MAKLQVSSSSSDWTPCIPSGYAAAAAAAGEQQRQRQLVAFGRELLHSVYGVQQVAGLHAGCIECAERGHTPRNADDGGAD